MPQSTVIPVSTGATTAKGSERSIGAILMDAGKITAEDAERILHAQREQGLRFGDAAVKLGIVSQADVELAISHQYDFSYVLPGQSNVSRKLVGAYRPFTAQSEALRAIRSQLMLRWFDADMHRRALTVVSAERGEGRSFLAANLAVVFSQLGERTLLVDADMRNPSQHELFGLENRTGLAALLSGRSGPDAIQRIPSLRDLSVLPTGVPPPNPQELLARPQLPEFLEECAKEFDVILLDSPPAALYADAQTLAARAGAALIVARKNATPISKVRDVLEALMHAKAPIVGTVLNDF